ncbi:DUF4231 domain-containing protein [Oceanobacillus profundus]|uniref:DUF4231 domain-containing protein n=1 Tax=Oceanobacillus profundus TaxID=372463 RepID=UPI00203DDFAB|nr:DUF4231 domain-containing protein [Oceanobacillus profundus]MCM3396443.1 DUF4231 domain-containing protein [Oceanobacillus profundus]
MDIKKDDYLNDRLEDQISWYDEKSSSSQMKYKILKMFEIILASLIPVLSIFSKDVIQITWIIAIIGGSITIIESWLNISKYHENWIEYRSICETLRHEKYMFLTKTGVYSVEDPFPFLVERIESIISKENVNWANLNKKSNGGH